MGRSAGGKVSGSEGDVKGKKLGKKTRTSIFAEGALGDGKMTEGDRGEVSHAYPSTTTTPTHLPAHPRAKATDQARLVLLVVQAHKPHHLVGRQPGQCTARFADGIRLVRL